MHRAPIYDVFVSYNHRDKKWATELVAIIRSCGVSVFFDYDDIAFGESIPKRVTEALQTSRAILILLSRNSIKSKWVSAELSRMFMRDPDGSAQSVIPIIMENIDISKELPMLESLRHVDLADPEQRQSQFESLLRQLGVLAKQLPRLRAYQEVIQVKSRTPARQVARSPKPRHQVALSRGNKIAIVGMGYMGSALAAALLDAGHSILGIERHPLKLDSLRRGRSHLYEPGVDDILSSGYRDNILSAEPALPVDQSGINLIVVCVGPSLTHDENAQKWDSSRFLNVLTEIGESIRSWTHAKPIPIVITATLQPADCVRAVRVIEDAVGSPHGVRFSFAVNPVFLREGVMLSDLRKPPFIVLGSSDGQPNSATVLWSSLMRSIANSLSQRKCPEILLPMEAASLLKLSSNAFHALKAAFANEIGRICKASGVSSNAVMSAFARDQILNVSSLYLTPGFSFGGSCLRKDIHALLTAVDPSISPKLTLLSAIQESNAAHLRHCAQKVQHQAAQLACRNIGIFGLTFKPGTDDMRDSPAIELINSLPRNLEIVATDQDLLRTSNLTGTNQAYWQDTLSTANIRLATGPLDVVRTCRVLVIAKAASFPIDQIKDDLKEQHLIIDLVGDISPDAQIPCRVERLL